MAIQLKELDFKLKDYPNVRYNMREHLVFNDFLEMATEEQLDFCEDFFDDNVEILWNESQAGTGKTMCSVACAYADYLNKDRNLVFVISPVSEDLGSRPGNQTEKEMAYFMGLHDAIIELNMRPEQVITEMLLMEDNVNEDKEGNCWVSQISHLFLRGGNLRDATIIINEAQNFKRSELKKVLTRIHTKNSTVIVEGNFKQIDLKDERKSGFGDYMDYFRKYDGAVFHNFTVNFRSKLAQYADDFKW
ncbi:PhoH-related protein [Staphylococcus phage Stab22]|nr:PhoH-related protein [Staphylococcus phage Stab22]